MEIYLVSPAKTKKRQMPSDLVRGHTHSLGCHRIISVL